MKGQKNQAYNSSVSSFLDWRDENKQSVQKICKVTKMSLITN